MDLKNPDKWKHGAAGFVVALVVGLLMHPAVGLVVVGVGAWLKEDWWDKGRGKGIKDGWDAFATLVGAIPAVVVLSVLAPLLSSIPR